MEDLKPEEPKNLNTPATESQSNESDNKWRARFRLIKLKPWIAFIIVILFLLALLMWSYNNNISAVRKNLTKIDTLSTRDLNEAYNLCELGLNNLNEDLILRIVASPLRVVGFSSKRKLECEYYLKMAEINIKQNQLEQAKLNINNAAHAFSIRDEPRLEFNYQGLLCEMYSMARQEKGAVNAAKSAAAILEDGNCRAKAFIWKGIAYDYFFNDSATSQRRYIDSALVNYERAYVIAEVDSNKAIMAEAKSDFAFSYVKLLKNNRHGSSAKKLNLTTGSFKEATSDSIIEYIRDALEIRMSISDTVGMAKSYEDLCVYYIIEMESEKSYSKPVFMHNYDSAYKYFDLSTKLSISTSYLRLLDILKNIRSMSMQYQLDKNHLCDSSDFKVRCENLKNIGYYITARFSISNCPSYSLKDVDIANSKKRILDNVADIITFILTVFGLFGSGFVGAYDFIMKSIRLNRIRRVNKLDKSGVMDGGTKSE